jgi:glyoxalase family protein
MRQNGIHHVTAIAGPARRNLDFYRRMLGLRLVKKTVNFDDPGTYHFYYGDEAGQPGTILTFFPWEHASSGRLGTGEIEETAFRVPERSIGHWIDRFVEKGLQHGVPERRFGETVIAFRDPDGMRLSLVAIPGIENEPAWSDGEIPVEHAIRGLQGVRLLVAAAAPTGAILSDILGFAETAREPSAVRYRIGDTALGGIVDVHETGNFPRGTQGAGTVHHIAFRAADDMVQAEMVEKLARDHGIRTTEQKNREYFRSVYFREPNGILFEIATDDPGFAIDEPAASLGQALKLRRFLEPNREQIEAVLPKIA